MEPKELLLGKDGGAPPCPRSQPDPNGSEPHIDIAEVIGSIPIAPTIAFGNTRLAPTATHRVGPWRVSGKKTRDSSHLV
jgi:hypothetical protein